MDKSKIISKVKLKLDDSVKRELPRLIALLRESKPDEMVQLLEDTQKRFSLSDEAYASLLEILIEKYQLVANKPEHSKKLKEITNKPPVKIYFDLLY